MARSLVKLSQLPKGRHLSGKTVSTSSSAFSMIAPSNSHSNIFWRASTFNDGSRLVKRTLDILCVIGVEERCGLVFETLTEDVGGGCLERRLEPLDAIMHMLPGATRIPAIHMVHHIWHICTATRRNLVRIVK